LAGKTKEKRFPFAVIPSGWFVIAMSEELRPGQIVPRRYFDRDLAMYRTESGEIRVIDAFCPHMGAHLGYQGHIQGEELTCGFHGFSYGPGGQCVRTAYGDNPPRASLSQWTVREQSGMILIWHDAAGTEPAWEVPPLPEVGFNAIAWRRFSFPGHPQETTENSVDYGHFLKTHGFPAANTGGEIELDGPVLRAKYGIRRSLHKKLLPKLTMTVNFDVTAHGLGYSQVDGHIPEFGTDIRLFVLPIPVDDENVDLVLGASCRSKFKPLSPITRWSAIRMLCNEVGEDIAVWRHKRHLVRPALAKSEGAVATYRRWCRQFYPEPDTGRGHEGERGVEAGDAGRESSADFT
jgi:nitrite reductase/ring-hydroxylating ferredoxin subunit